MTWPLFSGLIDVGDYERTIFGVMCISWLSAKAIAFEQGVAGSASRITCIKSKPLELLRVASDA
jgi:hypothetical protein